MGRTLFSDSAMRVILKPATELEFRRGSVISCHDSDGVDVNCQYFDVRAVHWGGAGAGGTTLKAAGGRPSLPRISFT